MDSRFPDAHHVSFYVRGDAMVKVETRNATDRNRAYEMVISIAGGAQSVEVFPDTFSLQQRQRALTATLRTEGWEGPFGHSS